MLHQYKKQVGFSYLNSSCLNFQFIFKADKRV